jgi:hypothetical protein
MFISTFSIYEGNDQNKSDKPIIRADKINANDGNAILNSYGFYPVKYLLCMSCMLRKNNP